VERKIRDRNLCQHGSRRQKTSPIGSWQRRAHESLRGRGGQTPSRLHRVWPAEGFDPGLALHMGKILECAAIACTPGQRQRMPVGALEMARPAAGAEPRASLPVASIALTRSTRRADPLRLPGPGGCWFD